jgi:hypothetical protein
LRCHLARSEVTQTARRKSRQTFSGNQGRPARSFFSTIRNLPLPWAQTCCLSSPGQPTGRATRPG